MKTNTQAPQPVEPPLHRHGLAPIALSLALGAAGGAVFATLNVPLPWMLGAIVANTIAAVRGWPVTIPHTVRVIVISIVGVFLGASFSPDMLDRLAAWAGSLSLMFVFIPLVTLIASEYFRRFAGFDQATAIFSGAPGTLTAMVIVGGSSGGDERLITLAQGLRAMLVVMVLPNIVAVLVGHPEAIQVIASESSAVSPQAVWLIGAAVTGFVVAHVLNLPAIAMATSMVVTAALYLAGVVTWHAPDPVFQAALWILGSAIGSRFAIASAATFFRVSRHAIVATGVVIVVSAAFAGVASLLTGTPYLTSLLSFTPGGVAEMCLIAIAFDIDPTFVAVHHLLRIAILVTLLPIGAKLFLRMTHRKA